MGLKVFVLVQKGATRWRNSIKVDYFIKKKQQHVLLYK